MDTNLKWFSSTGNLLDEVTDLSLPHGKVGSNEINAEMPKALNIVGLSPQ